MESSQKEEKELGKLKSQGKRLQDVALAKGTPNDDVRPRRPGNEGELKLELMITQEPFLTKRPQRKPGAMCAAMCETWGGGEGDAKGEGEGQRK